MNRLIEMNRIRKYSNTTPGMEKNIKRPGKEKNQRKLLCADAISWVLTEGCYGKGEEKCVSAGVGRELPSSPGHRETFGWEESQKYTISLHISNLHHQVMWCSLD